MWDVPRFAEFHEYNCIIAENVVEVTRWPLFTTWLQAMHVLGYEHKIVSLNSMFCHPTPQSRDRVYIVFWKKGNRQPDLDIRPKAPCPKCERVVERAADVEERSHDREVQNQYVFTCPDCRTVVTPFYYAALNAIDFSLAAERIGDRARPLKERTLERIRYGLQKYGNRHLIIRTNMTSGVGHTRARIRRTPHGTDRESWLDGLFSPFIVRSQHSTGGPHARLDAPMGTATASGLPGLITPFIVGCANSEGVERRVKGADDALGAVHAGGNNYALVGAPFLVDTLYHAERSRGVHDPMMAQTARQSVALVSPAFIAVLRTNSKAAPLDAPLHTLCTGGGHHVIITGGAQMSMRDADAMRVAGLDRELMSQGCAPQQALIQPAPFFTSYYGGLQAAGVEEPVDCVNTRDRHALVSPAVNIDDCYFRMLQPHEIGAAMAFPGDYVVTGNKRDRVKQYGNAVTPPAMDDLVRRAVAALAPEVAA
jgi:DNA (cytosine-5)-methyltransferase 1